MGLWDKELINNWSDILDFSCTWLVLLSLLGA